MDPELMATICTCPECTNKPVTRCARCGDDWLNPVGYIPCEEVREGEIRVTALDERDGVAWMKS